MDVGRASAFLPDAELGGQDVCLGNKVEDVVAVGSLPEADFLAYTCAAPLVEVAIVLTCST